jgi:hypothetical protein
VDEAAGTCFWSGVRIELHGTMCMLKLVSSAALCTSSVENTAAGIQLHQSQHCGCLGTAGATHVVSFGPLVAAIACMIIAS